MHLWEIAEETGRTVKLHRIGVEHSKPGRARQSKLRMEVNGISQRRTSALFYQRSGPQGLKPFLVVVRECHD